MDTVFVYGGSAFAVWSLSKFVIWTIIIAVALGSKGRL